jgi:hypothetical protein
MFGRRKKQVAAMNLMPAHTSLAQASKPAATNVIMNLYNTSPSSILTFVGVLANALLFAVSVYFLFYTSPKKNKNKAVNKKGKMTDISKKISGNESDEAGSLAESDSGTSSSSSLDGADSGREVRAANIYGPYPKVRPRISNVDQK